MLDEIENLCQCTLAYQAYICFTANQALFKEVKVECNYGVIIKILVPKAKYLDKLKSTDAC